MKKMRFLIFLSLISLCLINIGCKDKNFKEINPEFVSYISSYTSGSVSSQSSIKIQLSSANESVKQGDQAKGLFDFKPNIKGEAKWLTNRIIEFTPEKPLKSGEFYEVNFNLGKIQDVPKDFKTFSYNFQVIRQFVDVQLASIEAEDAALTKQKVSGTIETADFLPETELAKIFKASLDGNTYPVVVTKGNTSKSYLFEIIDLPRSQSDETLKISWDGAPINLDLSGSLKVEIPALGDFKILKTRVFHDPERYVSILFSDPLKKGQNLSGLVWFKNKTSPKLTINGNEIKVFPKHKVNGKEVLIIQNVRNAAGKKIKLRREINITFDGGKPEIELLGKGIILPDNEGIKFPFKTKNLKAVKIKVTKIYEDNIAQFLQVNQIDGDRQILRVGRVVYQNSMELKGEKKIDFSEWNTFSLKLNDLIDPEPGAIYRVELSFGKKESLYRCKSSEDTSTAENTNNDDNWDNEPEERSNWDYYQNNNSSNYDYSQRTNPCNDAFYSYNTTKVVRNVLASNMGVITKLGLDNTMTVAVTDLRTTEPIDDVNVNVINYQQQTIASTKTNEKGLGQLKVMKKPFLLIASKEKQKAYVRLDNGSSLSTSKFDVSGNVSQKGIKGFIYGERGVWRPGDTLFLNFMLQDKEHLLPKGHPISFELFSPEGQLIDSKINTTSVGNIYNFTTTTSDDYPTGNWMARVKVGGAVFSKRIKIETVKPNRLKVNLDFGKERLSIKDANVKGTLSSKWLHGAIAKNLKADVFVSMRQARTTFSKYSDYIFDDPGHTYSTENQKLFKGKLNSEGIATINSNINVNNSSPGMLNANFRIRVFEEGGDFSTDQFTIPYAPYKSFVGVKLPKGDKARGMLLTDIKHPIKIATLDPDGKPVSTKVRVDVYKLEWKYWWEKNDQEDLSKYVGSTYKKPLHTDYVTSINGNATANFEIKYPDWGRYYVRVIDQNSGHATGKIIYADWPGWAGRASKDNPGGASMLVFSTDKQKYDVGEPVKVTIPTAEKGRALVSVESGSRVVETYWVEAKKESTQFSFIATEEMAPNVYVNVTLIQPHQYEGNDLPIRLYGMTPISVEDPKTHLSPVIDMPDELHPEEKVTIKVSEENQQAMEYTIAVVDEGLLDITRFKTPNPWSTFYAREALGVRSWDMYDYVLGASSGDIAGLLEIGGGDELAKKGGKKANRFKPVVRFMGPFSLEKGKENTHSFTMPQYIGSVKTMIVASHESAYGKTSKATPVKQPLMVLSTLPRVLSPGEKVTVPVNVFTMNDDIKNVSVSIKTKGVVETNGSTKKQVTFSEAGEKSTDFELTVPNNIGYSEVEITAVSGTNIATHKVEIDVRIPNPPTTTVIDKILDAGETWNAEYNLNGIKGTNSAYLEVSNIPAINLEERLKYLIRYPHGCVEQTTSSGFPQLFLENITELDLERKEEINKNVKATIERLLQFQHTNGGFRYWPTNNDTDDWASSYVGHFLLEAKAKGYSIPSGVLSKWTTYQNEKANSWRTGENNRANQGILQAYRLYTLSLAGKPAMGAMNRLKENDNLSNKTTWRLAAAYAVAGQKEVAKQLIFGKSYDVAPYTEMANSYGSDVRDKAMILETLLLLNEKEKAFEVLKTLSGTLGSKKWLSTQTTAYSLIAISKLITGNSYANNTLKYSYAVNGKSSTSYDSGKSISKNELSTRKVINKLQLQNTSGGVLFVRVVTRGTQNTGVDTDLNNDLQMFVSYLDLNNNKINPKSIKQGEDFKVEVTIKNSGYRGNYEQLALSHLFPSGWEIQNLRNDKTGDKHIKSTPEYMDVRDDRIHYYFDLKQGEQKTFVSLLNAAYLGKFYLPSIYCEAMYDNSISAKKAGSWTEVIK